MVDVDRLKERIEQSRVSMSFIAKAANMDRSTLYRKLGASGEGFTIAEATAISKAIGLSAHEVTSIFFTDSVA